MKLYKKEKLIETKLFQFHRNLQFQKFIKTSPSVLLGCGTRTKLICIMHPSQPLSPTTTQWLGKHHTVHTSQF